MAKHSKKTKSGKVKYKDEVVHRHFIDNLNKLVGSWFKNIYIPTPVPRNEAEKIKNLLPSLFQTEHGPKVNTETKRRKQNKKQNRFYIDISKLDKNPRVNEEEKEKLTRLIEELKCELPREKKCVNESRKKKTVVKKVNNTFLNESKGNKRKRRYGKRNEEKKYSIKSKKSKDKCIRSSECQICLAIVEGKENKSRRKKRKQSATITFSREKILETIMELDPRAHGDTISMRDCRVWRGSKESQNINIKNIELKYVNPTYVVQYSTNTNNDGRRVESYETVGLPRFSSAALEAHLGQRPALNVGGTIDRDVTMHYDPSSSHVIGVGQETERMKVERDREISLRQSMRQSMAQRLKSREDSSVRESNKQTDRSRDEDDSRVSIVRRRVIDREASAERGLQKQVTIEEPDKREWENTEFDKVEYRIYNNCKPREQVMEKEACEVRKWPTEMREPLEVMSQYDEDVPTQPRSRPTGEHRCKTLRGFVRRCLCLATEESEADLAKGRAKNWKKPAKAERITENEFHRLNRRASQKRRVTFTQDMH